MINRPLWNWQQTDWPTFRFERSKLDAMEAQFLRQSGVFSGCIRHISEGEREQITVDLISEEALNTSEIEGEILNRDSLQSSIRRNFGLATDNRKIPPAEQGIAQMMGALYRELEWAGGRAPGPYSYLSWAVALQDTRAVVRSHLA